MLVGKFTAGKVMSLKFKIKNMKKKQTFMNEYVKCLLFPV